MTREKQGLSQGKGDRTQLPPTLVPQLGGTTACGTHAGAHALQVGGVHGGAQRHGPSLGLLQVALHLHDVELEVHTSALLDLTLLVNLLQLLLHAGQDALVWNEN